MDKYIWLQNRRYYYYETYDTWRDAYEEGRHHKRRNGSKYWIVATETGFMFPQIKYRLYLTKTIRLF